MLKLSRPQMCILNIEESPSYELVNISVKLTVKEVECTGIITNTSFKYQIKIMRTSLLINLLRCTFTHNEKRIKSYLQCLDNQSVGRYYSGKLIEMRRQ